MLRRLTFFWIFILFSELAFASNALKFNIHQQYISPRAMGMGNAFIAAVDDYNAVMYNPAALARFKKWQWNNSLTNFAFSRDFVTFFQDIDTAAKAKNNTEVASLLINQFSSRFYGRASFFESIYARPGWGIAFIPIDLSIDTTVHQQIGPALNFSLISDSTLAFGYGTDYPLLRYARTSLGYTVKAVHRVSIDQSFTPIELASNNKVVNEDVSKQGLALDVDLGALITPDLPTEGFFSLLRLARPTFAVVMRNALDSKFKQSGMLTCSKAKGQSVVPEKCDVTDQKMHRRLDIGSRWRYPDLWIFHAHGTMDIKNILHPNISPLKSLHLGLELNWRMYSWWKGAYRLGLNQGYFTIGASAQMAWFNIDLASYGEEFGSANVRKENRVFMAKLNFDL